MSAMKRKSNNNKNTLRSCRILLVQGMCLLLALTWGSYPTAVAQTAQQQQLERQREQERERQQEQERQREEQQRQQEQQREQEQERQRQEQQQQQERQQEQERQRQEQQQEERQRQQQQQREQQQSEQQQREAQQRNRQQPRYPAPARPEPPDPGLRIRPVSPEPIQPVRVPEPRPIGPAHLPVVRPEPEGPRQPEHPPIGFRPDHGPEILPDLPHGPMPGPPEFRPGPAHFDLPHPIRPLEPVVPERRPEPLHLDPLRRDDHRVIVERPAPRPVVVVRPTTEVILGLAPPPRRPVVVIAPTLVAGPGLSPTQSYAAAQAQLQTAQASCAQADAYQNYVTSVISNQNNQNQNVDQLLQTIADNTSNPDTQNAILGAIGQPNSINDALQQQLQSQASTYESLCQTRLAAAQAAMPPDPSQLQAAPGFVAQSAVPAAAAPGSNAAFSDQQFTSPPPQSASAADQPAPGSGPACTSGVTMSLPQVQGSWGAWVPLGNTGLVFGASRVNATTLTWRFFNAGSQTVASMSFTYTYTDADTGQTATQPDVLPYALHPGQSVGGWAAYTANTRGSVSLQITQIACQ